MIPYRTESVHFFVLMNSATKARSVGLHIDIAIVRPLITLLCKPPDLLDLPQLRFGVWVWALGRRLGFRIYGCKGLGLKVWDAFRALQGMRVT